jgi:hypothetical protein
MTGPSVVRGHRHLPKRLRLNFRGARAPSTRELDEAIGQVRRSGVVPVIAFHLHRRRDAESRCSVKGYEVAITLHGYLKAHRMALIDIVRLMNALSHDALNLLGMPRWTPIGSYDRFQRLHSRVSAALDEGWNHIDPATGDIVRVDRDWYRGRVLLAAVPTDVVEGCALALDGTDMPTWGRLHGDVETVDLDGETPFDDEESA